MVTSDNITAALYSQGKILYQQTFLLFLLTGIIKPKYFKEKKYFQFASIYSNFPRFCQKIAQLFLNDLYNVVLLLDTILLFLSDVT